MKGTHSAKVGPVTVNCMDKDAKILLDKLVEEFNKSKNDPNAVHNNTAYSGFYWATRYSGLIEPSSPPIFKPQDVAWVTRQDAAHLKRLFGEHKMTEEGHRYWRQFIEAELSKRES